MKNHKKFIRLFVVIVSVVFLFVPGEVKSAEGILKTRMPLKGKASGGKLVLGIARGRNARFVSVETLPGEPAEHVAEKLAYAIADSNGSFYYRGPGSKHDRKKSKRFYISDDNVLTPIGVVGDYFFAGTEEGLGIPRPPSSLSCSYDSENDKILLNWINPQKYDVIVIRLNWHHGDGIRREFIDGNQTFHIIDRKKINIDVNDLNIWIVGLVGSPFSAIVDNGGIPAGGAAIHLSEEGRCQEEIHGIPFSSGILPNWNKWGTEQEINSGAFEEGEKFGKLSYFKEDLTISSKPFYQVIKGSKAGNVHGIYRKFMGLAPGHTYRIIADLTTLDMNSAENDWSVSLCAAYNRGGDDLTAEQLAGRFALPNGKKGEKAGAIASFGKGKGNTQGKFAILSSDADTYITLPQDVNTITVWVRFDCKDPNGRVGFSGVKLEDITGNENIKTLEQIQQEENLQEAKLLKWEEAALRAKAAKKPTEPNQ